MGDVIASTRNNVFTCTGDVQAFCTGDVQASTVDIQDSAGAAQASTMSVKDSTVHAQAILVMPRPVLEMSKLNLGVPRLLQGGVCPR